MLFWLVHARSEHHPPSDSDHAGDQRRSMGIWLFLASLAALFTPLLIIFLILRRDAGTWPPPGMPPLPPGLWLSTLVLLAISVVLDLAVRSVRGGRLDHLQRWMVAALTLATLFLINQALCWAVFLYGDIQHDAWRFAGFFYFFTAIHALHVIGGFVPLMLVAFQSRHRQYSPQRHAGVRHCAMYWHFLDIVWLVMFAVMLIPG